MLPLLFAYTAHSRVIQVVCDAWKRPWKNIFNIFTDSVFKEEETLDSNSPEQRSHLYLLGWTCSLGSCTLNIFRRKYNLKLQKPLHMFSQTLFVEEVQTTLSTLDKFTSSHIEYGWDLSTIVFQPQRSSEINILMGCVLMMNFWNICTYFHGKYFTINRRGPIWMISKILEFTFLLFPARPLFTFTFILTFRPEDQPRVLFWSTRRTVAKTPFLCGDHFKTPTSKQSVPPPFFYLSINYK